MSKITILHLSDLHISEESKDQKIVLDALFNDITSQRSNGLKYDLIIFSGDLMAKGNYSEENKRIAKEEFFKKLLDTTGLSSDNLFIVPGNHDLETSKIPAILKPAFDALKSVDQVNDMIDNIDLSPYLWNGFSSFNSMIDEVCTATPLIKNDLFRGYRTTISGINIGICCINSAWMAKGSPNDGDYGKLLVGQRQIDKLLMTIKDCELKFAILHHPLNWLMPFDQSIIQQQLYREFNAIFYGHNHSANSVQIAGSQYHTFISNSGCLYQSRTYFNGYSLIEYSKADFTWNVKVREYYNTRNCFDTSTRFAENGESTFKISLAPTEFAAIAFPSPEYINAIQDSVNSHLLTNSISDIAPKNLQSMFVHPPLSHVSERQLSEDNTNGEEINYLDLPSLISNNEAIFFVGQKEYGKTTLLHYICSEFDNSKINGMHQFGCYINLQSVKPTEAGIIDGIILFSKGAYRKAEFIDLLNAGRMLICFDNLPVHDDKILNAIKSFIDHYPKNKILFSVSETFQSSISQRVIPKLGLEAPVVYLHSFGRSQTRNLIAKWFGDTNEALREKVDAMLSSLRRLNIPRTPFLISALLWIQEKNIAFNPVNQAEILDILVDGILDKLRETKERSSYDSTVKRHFLTELAFSLHQTGKTQCTHNELDKLVVDYFSNKGLPSASGPFIDELKQKGVLVDLGEDVGFKFDCLRAFFLSLKIKESSELHSYAISPAGFIQLGEELDYYTGKNRAQKCTLIGAMEAVEYFFKEANIDIKLDLFDQISLNESPISSEHKISLEKKILGERPTIERQEEMLDEFDMPFINIPQSEVTPSDESRRMADFFSALQTASAILRNSELIDDVDLKKSSYSKLIRHWSYALMVILASIELFIDEAEKNSINEIIPGMPKEISTYMLKLLAPNAIFAMALESLGTSKLELMIKNSINDMPETICKLLNTSLYIDLNLKDRLDILENLLNQKNSNRFVTEIAFFKLIHLFMFRKLHGNEEAKIKGMIGDIFARLSDSKNKLATNSIKANVIASLDKNRLLKEARRPN